MTTPRDARPDDTEAIAELWHAGWIDAHRGLVPPALEAMRTLPDFRSRLPSLLPMTRVAAQDGAIMGFAIVKEAELYQIYVARDARGTGLAARLIADAEARIAAEGHATAWLHCAPGNHRAARFYAKCGWQKRARGVDMVDTSAGPFALDLIRFEKALD